VLCFFGFGFNYFIDGVAGKVFVSAEEATSEETSLGESAHLIMTSIPYMEIAEADESMRKVAAVSGLMDVFGADVRRGLKRRSLLTAHKWLAAVLCLNHRTRLLKLLSLFSSAILSVVVVAFSVLYFSEGRENGPVLYRRNLQVDEAANSSFEIATIALLLSFVVTGFFSSIYDSHLVAWCFGGYGGNRYPGAKSKGSKVIPLPSKMLTTAGSKRVVQKRAGKQENPAACKGEVVDCFGDVGNRSRLFQQNSCGSNSSASSGFGINSEGSYDDIDARLGRTDFTTPEFLRLNDSTSASVRDIACIIDLFVRQQADGDIVRTNNIIEVHKTFSSFEVQMAMARGQLMHTFDGRKHRLPAVFDALWGVDVSGNFSTELRYSFAQHLMAMRFANGSDVVSNNYSSSFRKIVLDLYDVNAKVRREQLSLAAVKQDMSGKLEVEQRKKLIRMFHLDVLPPMAAAIVRNQFERAEILESKAGKEMWVHIFCTLFFTIGLCGAVLCAYYLGFIMNREQQVLATYVVLAWFALDFLVVSTCSAYFKHIFIPSYAAKSCLGVTVWLLKALHSTHGSPRRLKNQLVNAIRGETADSGIPDWFEFDSSKLFFVSSRLAELSEEGHPEEKAILSFKTIWPLRDYGAFGPRNSSGSPGATKHRPAQSPAQWLEYPSIVGTGRRVSTLNVALGIFPYVFTQALRLFLLFPIVAQDIIVDSIFSGSCCGLLLFHFRLYSTAGSGLVFIPLVAVVACIVIYKIFSRLGMSTLSHPGSVGDDGSSSAESESVSDATSEQSRSAMPSQGSQSQLDGTIYDFDAGSTVSTRRGVSSSSAGGSSTRSLSENSKEHFDETLMVNPAPSDGHDIVLSTSVGNITVGGWNPFKGQPLLWSPSRRNEVPETLVSLGVRAKHADVSVDDLDIGDDSGDAPHATASEESPRYPAEGETRSGESTAVLPIPVVISPVRPRVRILSSSNSNTQQRGPCIQDSPPTAHPTLDANANASAQKQMGPLQIDTESIDQPDAQPLSSRSRRRRTRTPQARAPRPGEGASPMGKQLDAQQDYEMKEAFISKNKTASRIPLSADANSEQKEEAMSTLWSDVSRIQQRLDGEDAKNSGVRKHETE
jgi:hypothetical protein